MYSPSWVSTGISATCPPPEVNCGNKLCRNKESNSPRDATSGKPANKIKSASEHRGSSSNGSNRKEGVPPANPWTLDIGKIVQDAQRSVGKKMGGQTARNWKRASKRTDSRIAARVALGGEQTRMKVLDKGARIEYLERTVIGMADMLVSNGLAELDQRNGLTVPQYLLNAAEQKKKKEAEAACTQVHAKIEPPQSFIGTPASAVDTLVAELKPRSSTTPCAPDDENRSLSTLRSQSNPETPTTRASVEGLCLLSADEYTRCRLSLRAAAHQRNKHQEEEEEEEEEEREQQESQEKSSKESPRSSSSGTEENEGGEPVEEVFSTTPNPLRKITIKRTSSERLFTPADTEKAQLTAIRTPPAPRKIRKSSSASDLQMLTVHQRDDEEHLKSSSRRQRRSERLAGPYDPNMEERPETLDFFPSGKELVVARDTLTASKALKKAINILFECYFNGALQDREKDNATEEKMPYWDWVPEGNSETETTAEAVERCLLKIKSKGWKHNPFAEEDSPLNLLHAEKLETELFCPREEVAAQALQASVDTRSSGTKAPSFRPIVHIPLLTHKLKKSASTGLDQCMTITYDSPEELEEDLVVPSSPKRMVRGATLTKLVEHVTQCQRPSGVFGTALYLTFRKFSSTEKLLLLLVLRCLTSVASPHAEDIQRGSLQVLEEWFSVREEDPFENNEGLYVATQHFIHFFIRSKNEYISEKARTLGKELLFLTGQLPRYKPELAPPPKPILPSILKKSFVNKLVSDRQREALTLTDFHPLEVARQLANVEFTFFSAIKAAEYLDLNWTRNKAQAKNIRRLIDRFNKISALVKLEILHTKDLRQRAKKLNFFIMVAKHSLEINNLNGFMEIYGGLCDAAIIRLKKTWRQLPQKVFALTEEWKESMQVPNHKWLREVMAEVCSQPKEDNHPPCLPYLGVFLADITFIEDGNKNFVVVDETGFKHSANTPRAEEPQDQATLVNFTKQVRLARIVKRIMELQKAGYSYTIVPELSAILTKAFMDITAHQEALDQDKLYTLSLQLEPRGNK